MISDGDGRDGSWDNAMSGENDGESGSGVRDLDALESKSARDGESSWGRPGAVGSGPKTGAGKA